MSSPLQKQPRFLEEKNRNFRDFFDNETAIKIKSKYKKFDLVVANNVVAHIPNINSFVKGIKTILNKQGIATIEFQYAVDLIKKNVFDNIYHEHYFYHSFIGFSKILKKFNLKAFDVKKINTQGGSLRLYVTHQNNNYFNISQSLKNLIIKEKAIGVDKKQFYSKFFIKTLIKRMNFYQLC